MVRRRVGSVGRELNSFFRRYTKPLANPTHYDQAAWSYREGRLNYAPHLIQKAAETASLDSDSTVLDLGCGPGTIANEIAQYTGHVLGVDISKVMIEIGQEHAPDNVTYIQGSSNNMSFIDRPLRLVTFGRSFHWMHREDTLRILDKSVEPGGCLAFFYVAPFTGTSPSHQWWVAVRRLANTLKLGEQEKDTPLGKDAERDEIVLARSAFSKVSFTGSIEPFDWTLDHLAAWVRSRYRTSMVDPETAEQSIREGLLKALEPFGPGPWRTYNQHRVVIAQRPGDAETG